MCNAMLLEPGCKNFVLKLWPVISGKTRGKATPSKYPSQLGGNNFGCGGPERDCLRPPRRHINCSEQEPEPAHSIGKGANYVDRHLLEWDQCDFSWLHRAVTGSTLIHLLADGTLSDEGHTVLGQ